jgi:hypothetical protein
LAIGTGMSVASDGIVAIAGDTTAHGVLSLDKKMVVITKTQGPPGGYKMIIMTKMTGASFTTADLAGTWFNHSLVSADSPNWYGWAYGKYSYDTLCKLLKEVRGVIVHFA